MEEEEGKGEEPKKDEGTASPKAAADADAHAEEEDMETGKEVDQAMTEEAPPEAEPTQKLDIEEVVRKMMMSGIMAQAINEAFQSMPVQPAAGTSAAGLPDPPVTGGSSRSDGRPDPPARGGIPGPPAGILEVAGLTTRGRRTPLTPDEAITAQYALACSTTNRSEWQTFGRQVACLPEDNELSITWTSGDTESQLRAFRIWLSKPKSVNAASQVLTTRTNRSENSSKVVKHMTLDVALRALQESPYFWTPKYIEQIRKYLEKNKNFEKCHMTGEKVYAWPVERTTTEGNLKENLTNTNINAEPTVGSSNSTLALGGPEAPLLALENTGGEGSVAKGKGKGKGTKEKNPATNALKTLKDPWGIV